MKAIFAMELILRLKKFYDGWGQIIFLDPRKWLSKIHFSRVKIVASKVKILTNQFGLVEQMCYLVISETDNAASD